MDLFQARRQCDVTAEINIGSTEYDRFCESVKHNKPLKYKDGSWSGERKRYNILNAEVVDGGMMLFYLKEFGEQGVTV